MDLCCMPPMAIGDIAHSYIETVVRYVEVFSQ
jgi:hypothetical protein